MARISGSVGVAAFRPLPTSLPCDFVCVCVIVCMVLGHRPWEKGPAGSLVF